MCFISTIPRSLFQHQISLSFFFTFQLDKKKTELDAARNNLSDAENTRNTKLGEVDHFKSSTFALSARDLAQAESAFFQACADAFKTASENITDPAPLSNNASPPPADEDGSTSTSVTNDYEEETLNVPAENNDSNEAETNEDPPEDVTDSVADAEAEPASDDDI